MYIYEGHYWNPINWIKLRVAANSADEAEIKFLAHLNTPAQTAEDWEVTMTDEGFFHPALTIEDLTYTGLNSNLGSDLHWIEVYDNDPSPSDLTEYAAVRQEDSLPTSVACEGGSVHPFFRLHPYDDYDPEELEAMAREAFKAHEASKVRPAA